jgi:HPt (histidine-containing phosphotransfer) domain-containing protein
MAKASGMNDYVTKPFDPGELLGVLARWVPARPADEPAPMPTGEVSFELGLRNCLGRPQMYERVLRRFVEGRPTAAEAIEASLQQGDVAEGARHAHSLVSSGALIGSARLSSLAASLETRILGSDREATGVLLGELKSLETKVRAEVRAQLARSTTPAP